MTELQNGAPLAGPLPALSAADEGKAGYDAFLSYSNRADYLRARRVEAFLESIHQTPVPRGASLRQLQICRDGSDFRLPVHRGDEPPATDEEEDDPVWKIIRSELARSRYLIVFCSPESVHSKWVAREIKWFLRERGAGYILPAVTGGTNPVGAPEEVFPQDIRNAGLDKERIWYDLRGLGRSPAPSDARNPEDELVRLASDLLRWDSDRHGPLAALWQRERLRQRRRQATIALITGLALIGLAVLALWQASRSRAATARARANALVIAADSSADPVVGALLLAQIADEEEPQTGMRVAQKLVAMPLPQAVLRGHTRELRDVAFSPDGAWVLTGSWDGSVRLWPADGRGDQQIVTKFSKGVEKVAFSPGGDWIAAASRAGELRILPASLEDSGSTFLCDDEIIFLSFSPDSQWLATVTERGAASVWPVRTGHGESLVIPEGRQAIRVHWSREPEKGWLAASDGTVWRFSRDTNQTTVKLSAAAPPETAGWNGPFRMAAFSADGSVVSFANGRQIFVERTDGSVPLVLQGPADIVTIDLDANGSHLLAADITATVRIWSTGDGSSVRTLKPGSLDLSLESSYLPPDFPREPTDHLFARFSPEGSRVVTLAADSPIRIWNTVEPDSGEEPADASLERWERGVGGDPLPQLTLRGQEGSEVAAFNWTGTMLVTGANDGTVRVWRLSLPPEPRKLAHPGPVSSIAFGADGEHLLSVTRGEAARWWTRNLGNLIPQDEQAGAVSVAALDPTVTRVVVGYQSGRLRLWNLQGERLRSVQNLRTHAAAVQGVKFVPGGESVLSWGEDKAVIVQRVDAKARPAILRVAAGIDGNEPNTITADISTDGSRVVTAHDDGSLRVWPVNGSGQPVVLSSTGGEKRIWNQVAFSPDGSRILAVSFQGVEIWPSDGRGEPGTLPGASEAKEGWGVGAISPDGAWIAAGSFAGRVWVWRADGKSRPKVMRQWGELAHIGPVSSLAFTRDARRFVTAGGMDGRACVWSLDRPDNPVVIRQGGTITDAEFSPDGSLVASASEMGSVLVSRVTWRDLMKYLRSLTSATLTVEQRIMFLGETESEARAAYEIEERRYGRTPLPPEWAFDYPF